MALFVARSMNSKSRQTISLLVLALAFTLLNAFKPLCVDDALYYQRAQQVAEHPLDPYGFKVFWNDRPEPAIQVLAPPLFPYYWAVAIKLFGQHPFLWKLWLLPLALVLVFSLHALLIRFAPGHQMWLTWFIIISPIFLPSFNLMLEIPVAALGLSALVLFFRAADRDSLKLALVSALIAGLAMQTKYTGFILPPVILLYGIIFKKLRLALAPALLSLVVFWAIEGLFALSAGHSHLLYQSGIYGSVNPLKKYLYLAWPFVTIIGATMPALALLALLALKVSRRMILAAAGLITTGFLLIAFVPQQYSIWPLRYRPSGELITLAHAVFSLYGAMIYLSLAVVVSRLCRFAAGWSAISRWRDYKTEWFLLLWLLGETASYFLLSPIPAVRRVLGLLVVITLLIGRLLSKVSLSAARGALHRAIIIGSMTLGLIYYAVDLHDAEVEKMAAEESARRVRELNPNATTWYVARWGFQFYAERLGLRPVIADESELLPGDWLVISDGPHFPQPIKAHINRFKIEPVTQLTIRDPLPVSTMLGYYMSGIPLQHQEGPHRTVSIYRIVSAKTETSGK